MLLLLMKQDDNYIKNLPEFETNELTETQYHPMHPTIYFQLIQVNGFMDTRIKIILVDGKEIYFLNFTNCSAKNRLSFSF